MELENLVGILVRQGVLPSLASSDEGLAYMIEHMGERICCSEYFDRLRVGHLAHEERFEVPVKVPVYLVSMVSWYVKDVQGKAEQRTQRAEQKGVLGFFERWSAGRHQHRVNSGVYMYEVAKEVVSDFSRYSMIFEQVRNFHRDMLLGIVKVDGTVKGVGSAFVEYAGKKIGPDQMPEGYTGRSSTEIRK